MEVGRQPADRIGQGGEVTSRQMVMGGQPADRTGREGE